MDDKIFEQIISKGILFGSVALGVNENDIAIYKNDLPYFDYELFNPSNYFNILPERCAFILKYIYKNKYIDILILDTKEDLEVVRKSINIMKKIPLFLLKNKEFRIKLYEQCLLHFGWSNQIFMNFDEIKKELLPEACI